MWLKFEQRHKNLFLKMAENEEKKDIDITVDERRVSGLIIEDRQAKTYEQNAFEIQGYLSRIDGSLKMLKSYAPGSGNIDDSVSLKLKIQNDLKEADILLKNLVNNKVNSKETKEPKTAERKALESNMLRILEDLSRSFLQVQFSKKNKTDYVKKEVVDIQKSDEDSKYEIEQAEGESETVAILLQNVPEKNMAFFNEKDIQDILYPEPESNTKLQKKSLKKASIWILILIIFIMVIVITVLISYE